MSEMEDDDGRRSRVSGSRRTRSQVAPDWTVQESMILVNEVSAVEGDCHKTLSSFQKWKIIVENCNALDVARGLSQCRRKWDSLLSDYKTIKHWESQYKPTRSYWSIDDETRREFGLSEDFDVEVFRLIDGYVKSQADRSDSDPDSDPEAKVDMPDVVAESGSVVSKKQRRKAMHHNCHIERRIKSHKRSMDERMVLERSIDKDVKPLICGANENIIPEQSSREAKVKPQKCSIEDKTRPKNVITEDMKQMMAAKLRENVELINAILEGNLGETSDFVLADLKNTETSLTNLTRRQGDKLITCLGNLNDTIEQLCHLVQD